MTMYISCGTVVTKSVLFFFNAVVFVTGGSILGLGAWVALRKGFIATFLRLIQLHVSPAILPSVIEYGAQALLCAGATATLLGFLGCLGIIKESTLLLYMYGLSLIGALGIQVAAGAYGVIIHRQQIANLSSTLMVSLELQYTIEEKADAITFAWNDVMKMNGCCGIHNFTDFRGAIKWQRDKIPAAVVPSQCCILAENGNTTEELMDPGCPFHPTQSNSYYLKGCLDTLKTYFVFPAPIAAPICIGLGLIQVFGIILTLCLCCELDAIKVRESRVVVWNSEVFFRDKYNPANNFVPCPCPPPDYDEDEEDEGENNDDTQRNSPPENYSSRLQR